MSAEEDDKPTVVIDLKALKKAKEQQEKEIAQATQDLSFAVEATPVRIPAPSASTQAPVIFFEFGNTYFAHLAKLLPAGMKHEVVHDLPALNKWIKSKTPCIVVFAFDSNPTVINQLCAQLKSKFQHIKTVIVSEKLSEKKVRIHQASPAAAAGYLTYPFKQTELKAVLDPLKEKKAA